MSWADDGPDEHNHTLVETKMAPCMEGPASKWCQGPHTCALHDSNETRFHGQPGEGETYYFEKQKLQPLVDSFSSMWRGTPKELMDLLVTAFWIGKED